MFQYISWKYCTFYCTALTSSFGSLLLLRLRFYIYVMLCYQYYYFWLVTKQHPVGASCHISDQSTKLYLYSTIQIKGNSMLTDKK